MSNETDDQTPRARLDRIERALDTTTRWMRFMPLMAAAQILIGAPAFFISIVVAWATFVQADATRKMQEASAWPRLETGTSFDNSGDERTVAITLGNKGIGPALIQSVRITLDGAPYNDFPALAIDLNGGDWEGAMSQQAFEGVIQAGETLEIVRLTGGSMRAAFARALRDVRIQGEICYCSIYGTCWLLQTNKPLAEVAMCPNFGDEAFGREPSPYVEPEGDLPTDDDA